MQEIIKQVGSSRQLFETVNFAFMKIFDFLVKTALFGAFLLFLGDSRHKLITAENRARWLNKCADHIATELDFGRNL